MKLNELIRILSDLPTEYSDNEVVIVVQSDTAGGCGKAKINQVVCGFDWNSGKILIIPDKELKIT